jgi:hypothetical protein
MRVAAAIAPDDLSICDIAREAKVQSPKAKAQSLHGGAHLGITTFAGFGEAKHE